MIGILLLTASFVIPRLEGYQSSGYEFLSRGSFVLIDAAIFIPGLLFVILGNIIMEGFSMQKEMDEIMKNLPDEVGHTNAEIAQYRDKMLIDILKLHHKF